MEKKYAVNSNLTIIPKDCVIEDGKRLIIKLK